jgi:hypothetical protein
LHLVWARSTHPPPFSDFKSDPNRFNGTISTLVGLLTGLTALYLHGGNRNSTHQFSNITGTLPTELGRLSLLQQFICVNQRVTGTIPTEMAKWTRVRSLDITGNTGLTGAYEHLFELSTLTSLGLGGQMFGGGGTLSSRVSALTEIRTLSLPGMGLSGTMPRLTALSKLTSLRISSNAFHGQFPELNSTTISTLEIRRNQFSGALRLRESAFWTNVTDFLCQLQTLAGESNCLNCNDAPPFCACQARNCTPFMPPTTTATTTATTTTTTTATATPVSTSTMTTTAATTAAPMSTSTTAPTDTTSQSAAFSDAENESPDVTGIAIGASVGALVAVIGIAGIAFWACRKRADKPDDGPAKKGEPSGDYGLLPPSVSSQYEQGRLSSPSQLEPDYGRGRISGD